MKIFKFFLIIPLVAAYVSCNDWLDVPPVTERDQDKMFSTQQGFQDALTGCYIGMINGNAYGGELTFRTVEHFVWSYQVSAESTQGRLNRQDWHDSGVGSLTKRIFDRLYNIIAHCNLILDNIDSRQHVFRTPGMYEIIKAEALGLRAYCHFDLLRLWGPIPSQASPTALILPYVKHFTFLETPYSTFDDFCTSLLEDLAEAAKLLEDVDPVLGKPWHGHNYLTDRQFRINYYGVKGLMARTHLWMNNLPEALACAREVIEGGSYTLGSTVSMGSEDFTFSTEHIFALYKFDLEDVHKDHFANGNFYRGRNFTDADGIMKLYQGNNVSDIRVPELGGWWRLVDRGGTNSDVRAVSNKYNTYENKPKDRVPLIRLAEMYLIAAEAEADYEKGQAYLARLRESRNAEILPPVFSREQLVSHIKNEYRMEFYAEGLVWYLFKRLNAPVSDFIWVDDASYVPNYVIPLPDTESVLSIEPITE